MKKIYADCAATTKISDKAKEAMLSAFEIYGNRSGSGETSHRIA